jgi:hypothetical protein
MLYIIAEVFVFLTEPVCMSGMETRRLFIFDVFPPFFSNSNSPTAVRNSVSVSIQEAKLALN